MVGSACKRILKSRGYNNIVGKTSKDLDLRIQSDVYDYIDEERPDIIIDAAAKVGGILANSRYPFDFLMDNMQIQNNLIAAAHNNNISKFIFLGSSCIYPKFSKQPISEESLLTGSLEPTNEWYAIAKISGVKLIESLRKQKSRDYLSLMPTNLYGPNDNYDLNNSHVIPAMIRKFHEAKINNQSSVTLWGSGNPLREFLHVDDLANAVFFCIQNKLTEHIYNIGSGNEISIRELGDQIKKTTGFTGEILWNTNRPDGTPRKLLNSNKLLLHGWKPNIDLEQGLQNTYHDFLKNL